MPSTTSKPQVSTAVRPGPGPWVGVAPDGSVIAAPYLLGGPSRYPSGASGPAHFSGDFSGDFSGQLPKAAVGRRRADRVVFGAAALTGVLALIAPFLVLWHYGFTDGQFAAQTVVNGWGSVSAQPASFASSHSHDTDYGLPMVLAAVFLLGGAFAYPFTRRAAAAALATSVGASLAAGTALLLTLDRGGRDSATTGTDTWAVGPGFWLIVAAGGLGVLVALSAAVMVTLDLHAADLHAAAIAAQPAGADHPAPGEADRIWVAPPNPAWSAPVDPARFTPPWAP
jgi:hypothetical protein